VRSLLNRFNEPFHGIGPHRHATVLPDAEQHVDLHDGQRVDRWADSAVGFDWRGRFQYATGDQKSRLALWRPIRVSFVIPEEILHECNNLFCIFIP
jgi:hypothetical protein